MKHFWSTYSLSAIQQNVLHALSPFILIPTPLTTPTIQTDLPILNSLSYLFSSLGDNHLSTFFPMPQAFLTLCSFFTSIWQKALMIICLRCVRPPSWRMFHYWAVLCQVSAYFSWGEQSYFPFILLCSSNLSPFSVSLLSVDHLSFDITNK